MRGVYDNGRGRVYLADNDGRLEEAEGWLVTGKYTGGALQRYYIDAATHAARTSYFYVDGYGACYGIGGKGYVLRGAGEGYDSTSTWSALYADNDGRLATSKWVCTDAFGQGFQRYWFGKTAAMAKGRLVSADEGAGYAAYATSAGYVLRGTWDSGAGRVYLADNDGLLACGIAGGWLVTGAYTGGALQRYYIDAATRAARTSYFYVDGYGACYGIGGKGYVLRGAGEGFDSTSTWSALYADNDGRLYVSRWACTDAFGQGFQRYWFGATAAMAKGRVVKASEAGYTAYATPSGYVVRGSYDTGAGRVYLADNDGRLETATGWLVTGKYTGGDLQRYYLVAVADGASAACSGGFQVGSSHYFGRANVGYVLRGKLRWGAGMLLADNDGVMAWTEGWLITGLYDGGELQRYRIDSAPGSGLMGAHIGYFSLDGANYYGRDDEGYVVRGRYDSPSHVIYWADNDGRIYKTARIVNLDVPCYNQYSAGIPNGCEAAALTNVLNYYGFGLSGTDLADNWIPRSSWDFVWCYWGNPHSTSGNSIAAPGLTSAANNFLSAHGSSLRAHDVSGTSLTDLFQYLDNDAPVIIWSSIGQTSVGAAYAWQDGYFCTTNSHTVVLKGYNSDEGVVYLSDTISGYLTISTGWMSSIYSARGSQAVVIY